MTSANSLTVFGLLFGLYGYLGKSEFLQFLGLALVMLLIVSLMVGMAAAGVEIVAGVRRAWARPRSYVTVPNWYLTD